MKKIYYYKNIYDIDKKTVLKSLNKNHFVIYSHADKERIGKYPIDNMKEKGKFVITNFEYASNKNKNFLNTKQIIKLLKSIK